MYVERDLESKIKEWFDEKEMIAIIGPRQSGKTTLAKYLMDESVAEGRFTKDHVLYITLDDEIERLKFESEPLDLISANLHDDGRYLLILDEVQYVEKAGQKLKVIYDALCDRVKFVITGSSGLDLREIGASLVGRVVFFELYPFSFKEFLRAKDQRMSKYHQENAYDLLGMDDGGTKARTPLVHLDKLNKLLEEYVTYGGFPRVVQLEDVGKKEFFLRQLVTQYIEKDILKLYGRTFRNEALRVMKYLAFHRGGMLNMGEVSSDLGIDVRKVREVVDILENVFLIKLVRPFHKSLATELRKMPKIYFVDNGIRNVLAEDFVFSRERGFLLEWFVLARLMQMGTEVRLNYWRTASKAEVDFVLNGSIPLEVKSTARLSRAMRSFVSTYGPPRAFIVNYKELRIQKADGTPVISVPACLL